MRNPLAHGARTPVPVSESHASSGAGRAKIDVVLLSTDPDLRATIRSALGSTAALWCVSSRENAVGTLIAGRCAAFIIDLCTVEDDPALLFAKLNDQFPDLVLMATGGRDEERLARPLLSAGHLYRFLHKPVSRARAVSFMATAIRRHHELQELQTTMMSTMKLIVAKPRWRFAASTVVALLAVIAAAITFNIRVNRRVSVANHASPAKESASNQSSKVDELLSEARRLQAAKIYVSTSGTSALQLYQEALTAQPGNAEAGMGLERVIDDVLADGEKAVRERDIARAMLDLESARRVRPTHPRLPVLEAHLAKLSLSSQYRRSRNPSTAAPESVPESSVPLTANKEGATPLDQSASTQSKVSEEGTVAESRAELSSAVAQSQSSAATTELNAEQREVVRWSALASARRIEGKLIEPAADCARDYLLLAKSKIGDAVLARSLLKDEIQALVAALVAAGQDALANNQLSRAQDLLSAARNVDDESGLVAAFQRDVELAKQNKISKP